MKYTSLYVTMLPDGRIIEGGQTAESALVAAKAAGEDITGMIVDDVGELSRTLEGSSFRTNPKDRDTLLRDALERAGLPRKGITKAEVFALTPEQAVERLRPLFAFLKSEQRESVATSVQKVDDKGKPKFKKVKGGELFPAYETDTKAVLDDLGQFVLGPTKFISSKNPNVWAKELMGRNAKLVKDTLNADNPTTLRTKVSGDLIGLNLYPADKLVNEFTKTYGPEAAKRAAAYRAWAKRFVDDGDPVPEEYPSALGMQRFGFDHPLTQIITAIQQTGRLPRTVRSLPEGKAQRITEVPVNFTREQKRNIGRAFGRKKLKSSGERSTLDTFTTCSRSTKLCARTCLVYTGQNTSAFQNDWKKATCLFALVADPVAYLRLLVHALDVAGHAAANEVRRDAKGKPVNAEGKPALDAAEMISEPVPFFVRMNLLSDIPWEVMVPWLFNLYQDAPLGWYSNAPARTNPGTRKRPADLTRAWNSGAKRDFAVQFYDYTKLERAPQEYGVTNYDLTLSFSGSKISRDLVRNALYEPSAYQRVAVVFAGLKVKKEGDRNVYSRALYTAAKGTTETVDEAEEKVAKYGYGLPYMTDIFASDADKKKADKGLRLVVNSDRHDARPLDPPNALASVPVISGLAWKSTGGGVTVTDAKKDAFFFRAEQMIGEEGWQVIGPEESDAQGRLARVTLKFPGRGQKGRAEREARRLTALQNIYKASGFVTPTILVETEGRSESATFVSPVTGDARTDALIRQYLYGRDLSASDRKTVERHLAPKTLRKKVVEKVVGVYIVAETPREAHAGDEALSALPGTSS
jgi:hypothetical protein